MNSRFDPTHPLLIVPFDDDTDFNLFVAEADLAFIMKRECVFASHLLTYDLSFSMLCR